MPAKSKPASDTAAKKPVTLEDVTLEDVMKKLETMEQWIQETLRNIKLICQKTEATVQQMYEEGQEEEEEGECGSNEEEDELVGMVQDIKNSVNTIETLCRTVLQDKNASSTLVPDKADDPEDENELAVAAHKEKELKRNYPGWFPKERDLRASSCFGTTWTPQPIQGLFVRDDSAPWPDFRLRDEADVDRFCDALSRAHEAAEHDEAEGSHGKEEEKTE
jgi:hypothetical protein